jgi:hypothetical protein
MCHSAQNPLAKVSECNGDVMAVEIPSRSLHPANAFEFNELNIGMNVSTRRGVPQVLCKRTAFNPVAVLVDCTDYTFLHVREFVQFEPDKLVDVGAELDSLAGNKIGNVWHLVVLSVMAMFRQSSLAERTQRGNRGFRIGLGARPYFRSKSPPREEAHHAPGEGADEESAHPRTEQIGKRILVELARRMNVFGKVGQYEPEEQRPAESDDAS